MDKLNIKIDDYDQLYHATTSFMNKKMSSINYIKELIRIKNDNPKFIFAPLNFIDESSLTGPTGIIDLTSNFISGKIMIQLSIMTDMIGHKYPKKKGMFARLLF